MADDLDQLARRYRALAARLGELGYITPAAWSAATPPAASPAVAARPARPSPTGPTTS